MGLVAAACGLASLIVYAASGYGTAMLVLWLGGLIGVAAALWTPGSRPSRPPREDLLAGALLVAGFAPLYLVGAGDWPVQVDSDEIAIMTAAERYGRASGVDLFGLSDYLGHPVVLFVLLGNLGDWLGGVELGRMRLVHGTLGLISIAGSFVLLRQFLPRGWAVVGAFVVGVNHALLMLSRMAMRESTAAIVVVIALALLVSGLRRRNALALFLGGAVAGAGFYVYFPGRIAFGLWLLFLSALAVWWRGAHPLRELARIGAIAAAGFLLVATPVIIAGLRAPAEVNEQQRLSVLVFDEARELQKGWVHADSELDGILKNIEYGLGAFNNRVPDKSYNYENEGHGFVDPVTGILLWIGVAVALARLLRRRDDHTRLLPVLCFLALWLVFASLVNKAPDYPRLLITLPFVGYLVAIAIRALASRVRGRTAPAALTGALVAGILVWNLVIAADYIQAGRRNGDDIGNTGRFIEARRDRPNQTFHLVSGPGAPYFDWTGSDGMGLERLEAFAHEGQVVGIVRPDDLPEVSVTPPSTLFMSRRVWVAWQGEIRRRFTVEVVPVTPDGSRVAVEVAGDAPPEAPGVGKRAWRAEQVRVALRAMYQASADGDARAYCRHLTGRAARKLARGNDRQGCEAAVRAAFDQIPLSLRGLLAQSQIGRVRLSGDRAVVTVNDRLDVHMRRVGGRWKWDRQES